MKTTIVSLLLFISTCNAQSNYPQNYFNSPLDINLILSGSFAELRNNHFHSGLDIKTQGKEGLKTYASASGYVSRIKISRYGYGKALYIKHPNGYTTVYAHLKKFSPTIEAYVKKKQYKRQTFEIELFPPLGALKVSEKQLIAFTGNTGGSGGPHLHFEIRDNQERPLNPLMFGFNVKDTTPPDIYELFGYPISKNSHINGKTRRIKIKVKKQKDGTYKSERINAFGEIGFGIISIDKLDLASNKNGVNNIQTLYNGKKSLYVNFNRFSFDETKHLNRYIDYDFFFSNKKRIQKLFIEKNNPLSILKSYSNNGVLKIENDSISTYKVIVSDFKGNKSELRVPINGVYKNLINPKQNNTELQQIYASEKTNLKKDHISVEIPKNTFYEDVYINFEVINDTLSLHNASIPLQKSIDINFDVSNYQENNKNYLFIGRISKDGNKLYYSNTKKHGDRLSTRTKNLGSYTLGIDKENPKIDAINFKNKSWVSNLRNLKVKILDKISGIKNYRATINGHWILMEYDIKTQLLTYNFDDYVKIEKENNLKIVVTDNVGNTSTFESLFYKK
ncbi:MAG: M23 family metallopeptidase [Flavobacteriaceae bacterium]|nr:M23 family metallopeptidase [Flavobacteriaceae bacterium]